MALSQKHRSSIYSGLAPVIGEEEADALLSQFPSRLSDEPATKADLGLISGTLSATSIELRAEIGAVRADLGAEISEVRADLRVTEAHLRTEIADLRADMMDGFRRQTMWMVSALFGGLTVGMGVAGAVAAGLS